MKRIHWIALLLVAVFATGCATKPKSVAPRPEGTLAIVPFVNPLHDWQLLAGILPQGAEPVSTANMNFLDDQLSIVLETHLVTDYTRPELTRQCRDVVVFEEQGQPKTSAWKYWLGVGKCLPVDYLLVPMVLKFQERLGSDNGVTRPASVTMDLFLIDVKNERITRSRFEETQVGLSENLLTASKFFKRGGKWITAGKLAREGLDEKLSELGL